VQRRQKIAAAVVAAALLLAGAGAVAVANTASGPLPQGPSSNGPDIPGVPDTPEPGDVDDQADAPDVPGQPDLPEPGDTPDAPTPVAPPIP
jgi:hypothetical protein